MKKNFTQISNLLIKSCMSDAAFRTYILLKSYQFRPKSKVFPSLKTLSKIRKKSVRAITDHIAELVNLGLVKKKKRGFGVSNEYYFPYEDSLNDPNVEEIFQQYESDVNEYEENLRPTRKNSDKSLGNYLPPNNTNKNNKVNKTNRVSYSDFCDKRNVIDARDL